MVFGIIVLSLYPVPDVGIDLPSDKLLHLVAYFSIMGWFVQLYGGVTRVYYGIGFVVLGIVLELLQGLTSYRMLEVLDMVANGGGVVLAYLVGISGFDQLLARLERALFTS